MFENLRAPLLGALLATFVTIPPTLAASHPMIFKSVNVDLPTGDRMFPGPGAEAINNNCLGCHSAGMVLNQPPEPRATWQAEVDKMRAAYKAPIADRDVKPIVDYLARLKAPTKQR